MVVVQNTSLAVSSVIKGFGFVNKRDCVVLCVQYFVSVFKF